jgi:ABC-type Fe3+/spermidine/putrescine transport system ATPase subunit
MGITTVFVTHDQEEALEIADEIVIMNHGKIEQIGSAKDVFEQPATPFVQEFLGGGTYSIRSATPAFQELALARESRARKPKLRSLFPVAQACQS